MSLPAGCFLQAATVVYSLGCLAISSVNLLPETKTACETQPLLDIYSKQLKPPLNRSLLLFVSRLRATDRSFATLEFHPKGLAIKLS